MLQSMQYATSKPQAALISVRDLPADYPAGFQV